MDAEVKDDEATDNGQIQILIEPKKEVEDSLELIEPKVEFVDKMDVKIEDDDEYQHMNPYEYRDYLEHQEEEPVSCETIPEAPIAKNRSLFDECRMCRRTLSLCRFIDVENHASTHMNLQRFECPVECCDFKSCDDYDMTDHLKSAHSISRHVVKGRELTFEEDQKLRSLVSVCFPGQVGIEEINDNEYQHMIPYEYRDYIEQHTEEEQLREKQADGSKSKIECGKCGKEVNWKNKRNHALRHTGLKMFNCPVNQCSYKDYLSGNVNSHMKHNHKSCTDPVIKYEMTDEEIQELKDMINKCFPPFKVVRYAGSNNLSALKEDSIKCQKCGKEIFLSNPENRKKHAMRHTDLKKYECPVDQCGFKDYDSSHFHVHMRRNHKSCSDPVRKIEMSDEEKQVLKDMMNECFPGREFKMHAARNKLPELIIKKKVMKRKEKKNYICQICRKKVVEATVLCQNNRRNHGLEHADIMLYKCSVPDCQIQTKDQNAMIDHEVKIHDLLVAFSGKCRIPMTPTHIDEVERMFIRCFSE